MKPCERARSRGPGLAESWCWAWGAMLLVTAHAGQKHPENSLRGPRAILPAGGRERGPGFPGVGKGKPRPASPSPQRGPCLLCTRGPSQAGHGGSFERGPICGA